MSAKCISLHLMDIFSILILVTLKRHWASGGYEDAYLCCFLLAKSLKLQKILSFILIRDTSNLKTKFSHTPQKNHPKFPFVNTQVMLQHFWQTPFKKNKTTQQFMHTALTLTVERGSWPHKIFSSSPVRLVPL